MKTLALALGLALSAPACTTTGLEPAAESPRSTSASLKVLPLRFANAVETAAILKNMLRDVRIVADARTNSLVVSFEHAADLEELERALAQLDVEAPAKR